LAVWDTSLAERRHFSTFSDEFPASSPLASDFLIAFQYLEFPSISQIRQNHKTTKLVSHYHHLLHEKKL
jgi:hypothetical protein